MNKKLRFLKSSQLSRKEVIADDPLRQFFVWWNDIRQKDVRRFEKCLQEAKDERDLQTFLEANPLLMIQHLGGGHGRYVIPHKRLGSEFITDFVIGEKHSGGYEWQAVELENPNARMFTRRGNPTKELTHAIRQIQEWRAWLQRNQPYAARSRIEGGLGLCDIVAKVPALILIGKRDTIDLGTNELRRQMANELGIDIHSYEYLLDSAAGQAEYWESVQQRRP